MPVAIGVILDSPGPTYEAQVQALETAEAAGLRDNRSQSLLRQGATWSDRQRSVGCHETGHSRIGRRPRGCAGPIV